MLIKTGYSTIGLLIYKSKDNIFAQYSLEGYNQPIGISEFEGVNVLPENFKSSLPTIEEIEYKLGDK
ncbi:PDDEXK nuclease domain-containing protein [Bacteroides sp. 14(A)]|uniref:PDDEXK nuclease domain-containing protein n=1 Tax=Bacteroides sp. 14(A) TaxID=1163670 RepID=UPI0004786487|nr:PDDEXK nuclease domain-containing protein [Bacteroides sp. 14(A)]